MFGYTSECQVWKRMTLKAGIWAVVLLCMLVPRNILAEEEETVILTTGEWPPYYGENLPYYGLDSHIVTEAFALSGVKVIYKFYPWARAFAMARDDFDGGVGWGDLPEYHNDFYISETTSTYQNVFFHRKDFPFQWNTYADLKGLRVGLTLQYEFPEELMTMVDNGTVKVDWAPQDVLNFQKLLHGRIDIYPDCKLVGRLVMQRIFTPEEMDQITYNETVINEGMLHLILSKKKARNQQLITLFNEGLQKLKQSGKYDQILKDAEDGKYNVVPK